TSSQYCSLSTNTCIPACAEGSISSMCKCGSTITSSGYCCLNTYSTYQCCSGVQTGTCKCGNGPVCTTSQYCFTNSCVPICPANAAVPSSGCNCGGQLAVGGYCCSGVIQYTACANKCTANAQQNCYDSVNSLCSGSTYYSTASTKCVLKCSANGQQNCLDSANALCTGATSYSTSTAKCIAKCGLWGTSCMCGTNLCTATTHCWSTLDHKCYAECPQGKITHLCYCSNPNNLYNPSSNPTYYCCSGQFKTSACALSSVLGPCSTSYDCQSGLTCSAGKCCVASGGYATSTSYCCSGSGTLQYSTFRCN
ncbi:MAG TPA: hypothetical protein PLO51_06185, partial [Candidatus Micrarchaeota archaeon]|nr:hypothetical protein [Candidatus Micrarchaeota archaeon]